ncbi:MAG: RNA methyltransferase [Deltaproteobacteria bacterium]|nr:RNA methyltransferase [Deltaproteobacteria bacterium]
MLSIALLHHPVYNKDGQIVTTAVVNNDIHDIARMAKTFGIYRFYLVTPLEKQKEYAAKIIRHWVDGFGGVYNPSRREAFLLCSIKGSLAECLQDFSASPFVLATSAHPPEEGTLISNSSVKAMLQTGEREVLLLVGTGWGLSKEVLQQADAILEPIRGLGAYNHLSVRCASAIIVSRITGEY